LIVREGEVAVDICGRVVIGGGCGTGSMGIAAAKKIITIVRWYNEIGTLDCTFVTPSTCWL